MIESKTPTKAQAHWVSFSIPYKYSYRDHTYNITLIYSQTSHCHKLTNTQATAKFAKPLRSIMAPSSTTNDEPIMNLVNKRICVLRKKLKCITSIEESLSQGKPLNNKQQEVLHFKSSILALIDELEYLRQPISSALIEELELVTQTKNETRECETLAENSEPRPSKNNDVVKDILNLLYVGSLFKVKTQNDFTSTMLTKTHECGCYLTYDYVTDDVVDLLREKDLDVILGLYGLLISRPTDSSFSHKNMLTRCIES